MSSKTNGNTIRNRFAKRLRDNIWARSKYLMSPGGNVTLVNINYEFAFELVDIFIETIVDFLIEKEPVNFDQFGKFEVKKQAAKRVKNAFTNNEEMIIPELEMIRFYPSLRLKERIRGTSIGKRPRYKGVENRENLDIILASQEEEDGD